jgi:hypothetical protein
MILRTKEPVTYMNDHFYLYIVRIVGDVAVGEIVTNGENVGGNVLITDYAKLGDVEKITRNIKPDKVNSVLFPGLLVIFS